MGASCSMSVHPIRHRKASSLEVLRTSTRSRSRTDSRKNSDEAGESVRLSRRSTAGIITLPSRVPRRESGEESIEAETLTANIDHSDGGTVRSSLSWQRSSSQRSNSLELQFPPGPPGVANAAGVSTPGNPNSTGAGHGNGRRSKSVDQDSIRSSKSITDREGAWSDRTSTNQMGHDRLAGTPVTVSAKAATLLGTSNVAAKCNTYATKTRDAKARKLQLEKMNRRLAVEVEEIKYNNLIQTLEKVDSTAEL